MPLLQADLLKDMKVEEVKRGRDRRFRRGVQGTEQQHGAESGSEDPDQHS